MLALYATLQTFFATATDRLKGEEKGASATEYGIVLALVAVAVVGAFTFLQPLLAALFADVRATVGI
ncbi:Flp family type IVb pilin [Arthrobacter sp. GCM10027362]|uniref:Flp family type IVb pilin n=1 Tax=Arthrobacter sp. GCM10027362 TaxID=3273379 RepID=UPI0036380C76